MKSLAACFVAALVGIAARAAFADEPEVWRIVKAESAIRFIAMQAGAEFEGGFDEFDARIRFDPLDLEQSSARVEIPVTSVNTRSPDRDEVLLSEEWFHPAQWPRALFRTTGFRRASDGFEALAALTIRDVTKEVVLSFFLEGNRLTGETTIKRLDFGLGRGEWADTTWIGDEVTIKVDVVRALDTGD